jgi:hypothetical protein
MRGKSLMKRRAQLGGIRVDIFEEAHDRDLDGWEFAVEGWVQGAQIA